MQAKMNATFSLDAATSILALLSVLHILSSTKPKLNKHSDKRYHIGLIRCNFV